MVRETSLSLSFLDSSFAASLFVVMLRRSEQQFQRQLNLAGTVRSATDNTEAPGIIPFSAWLPTVDTLRNLFYAPTVEMKITFELLRPGRYAL